MSFAPEAQRKLAGGGAERNHRKLVEVYSGQLKFLHMSFAPEAQWKLAGGGAERNHRKRIVIYFQPRRGDRPASVCCPSGAHGFLGSRSRRFHRRLISGVPPGRRAIPDLCRNSSWTVCATTAENLPSGKFTFESLCCQFFRMFRNLWGSAFSNMGFAIPKNAHPTRLRGLMVPAKPSDIVN